MSDQSGVIPEESADTGEVSRRTVLRLGAIGGAGAALVAAQGLGGPFLARHGLLSADGAFGATSVALGDAALFSEKFPTSPLILHPFTDPLPVPKALRPVDPASLTPPPGPGPGQQNSLGNQQHQMWSSDIPAIGDWPGGSPDPIVYNVDLLVSTHAFTTSQVLPINKNGRPAVSFDATGARVAAGTKRTLPPSTIYGFNGTFPGPMINAEYGKPALVRFTNRLDENPLGLDRQDFGAPDFSFLTHLHNGHTAPESDGNPNYSMQFGPEHEGFRVKQWVDNLYLNWPAGGFDAEKQSFLWFHDHRMDHTGDNVYKGMVGLYPIYDPKGGKDMGDENQGLRLPGVRTNNPDGSFDVKYDIPLAIFDCALDDGVTVHEDFHDAEFPAAGNPRAHPEWWGKTFHRHFPNHGFVGDLFTVNCVAFPVLTVDRRKYRFRFLDASVARIYEFKLMSSTQGPKSAVSLGFGGDELQGQYRIPDGQQSMRLTQIASEGGLLPFPITRDSFELWPSKRREFIVDFTQYMDGTPTTKGDAIYLTNIMKMGDGRKPDKSTRLGLDRRYKVPVLKFVIGDPPPVPDASEIPAPTKQLRPLPNLPADWRSLLDNRTIFELHRGNAGGEMEWLINGEIFEAGVLGVGKKNRAGNEPLAQQKIGSFNLWELTNGGGGWVHPMHVHQEEHRVVMRDGRDTTRVPAGEPDDEAAKEDTVAQDPGEEVIVFRGFRDFVGPYVAHCHNLAHEDHAMMFGWEIIP